MNKKGWLRIVEAFTAVILIASVLFIIIIGQSNYTDKKDEIYKLQKTILNEVAQDSNLREAILSENIVPVNEFVSERIPDVFEYDLKICGILDVCNLDYYREEVYAEEIVISCTLNVCDPLNSKKLKIFMWAK